MQVMYNSWKEYADSAGKSDEDPVVMPWLFSKPFRQKYPEKIREIKARFVGGISHEIHKRSKGR